MFSLPNFNNLSQKGFAPVALVIFMLFGIAAGTLLVQNGVNFLPKANNSCSDLESELSECTKTAESDECTGISERLDACRAESELNAKREECQTKGTGETTIDGKRYEVAYTWSKNECKENVQGEIKSSEEKPNEQNPAEQEKLDPIKPGEIDACGNNEACKNSACAGDEVTYCDNRDGKPRAVRKSGGYWDPNHPLKDSNGCVFDFFDVPEKNDQCGKPNSKNGDVVYTTEKEAEEIDSKRNPGSSNKGEGNDADCKNEVYCKSVGGVLKPYRKLSTYYEGTGKDEKARCVGAKRVNGQLVPDPTTEFLEFEETGKSCEGKKANDVIEKSSSNEDMEKKPGAFSTAASRGRFVLDSNTQRTTFEEFFKNAQSNTAIKAKIDNAQKALNDAKVLIEQCDKDGDEAACAKAYALQLQAVALSREALAEAVAAGVSGVRVKTDLQIGVDNTNAYVKARAPGEDTYSRVFAEVENGKVVFKVRSKNGTLVQANPADLTSSGLKQNMTLQEYQTWINPKLENLRKTTGTQPAVPLTDDAKPASKASTPTGPSIKGACTDDQAKRFSCSTGCIVDHAGFAFCTYPEGTNDGQACNTAHQATCTKEDNSKCIVIDRLPRCIRPACLVSENTHCNDGGSCTKTDKTISGTKYSYTFCGPKASGPATTTAIPLNQLKASTPRSAQTTDTTSETVDFNLPDNSTAVTVTVTKPKPGNTGTGQTQFRLFKADGSEEVLQVSGAVTQVRTTSDLDALIIKWYGQNPGKNLPGLKFQPPKTLSP